MTKQVALANDTYRRLRSEKQEGESFSQVIERLLGQAPRKDPMSFLDDPPQLLIPADEFLEGLRKEREAYGRRDAWKEAKDHRAGS